MSLIRLFISQFYTCLLGDRYGYLYMWMVLRKKYHLFCSQAFVRIKLLELDPHAVCDRAKRRLKRRTYKSLGPNHAWHVDGYDKLKPYGFCISGCIDGFSRRIIWLTCGYTNNDPAVIAGYYVDAVTLLDGYIYLYVTFLYINLTSLLFVILYYYAFYNYMI